MNKNDIIKRFALQQDDKLFIARILDKLLECERKGIQTNTQFLNEREQAIAEKVIAAAGDSRYVLTGGYEGAERKVILFLPDYIEKENAIAPFRFIRADFPKENELSHRDFLGALMGCGVKRETVGDILTGKGNCDIIVLDDILQYIIQNLESAGRAKLSLTEINENELNIPERKYREVEDTVASLRIDSVVAAGFSMARAKTVELIRSGRVSLNFIECEKPDKEVCQGDIISVRGFGRLELSEAGALSRKGRVIVKFRLMA